MKTFLSFFAMAMLLVFAMTSCSKDNDPTPDPTPEVVEKGFAYGIVANEAFVNNVESVLFTYTAPESPSEQTETLKFEKATDGTYSAVLQKYTTKTGKYSVKAKLNLKADIDNAEKVSLAYGIVDVSGEKTKMKMVVSTTSLSAGPGKLASLMNSISEHLEEGSSGNF